MEEIVTLTIEGFSKKGDGVAPYKNCTVEIPHTIIGDSVEVLLRRMRKKKRKGKLLRLLAPSPFRCETTCPHANLCGGCHWQMMPYEKQLEMKEQIIKKAFAKNLTSDTSIVKKILPSHELWHYRNKMEFTFSENRKGTKYFGLIIARSQSYVFNLEECSIAPKWMAKVVLALRAWWEKSSLLAYNPNTGQGILRYATLREGKHTKEKMITLTIASQEDQDFSEDHIEGFLLAIREALPSKEEKISIYLRKEIAKKNIPTRYEEILLFGPTHIQEKIFLKDFFFFPITFFLEPLFFFSTQYFAGRRNL